MIPQHQAAIDMAQAELKYGHNEEIRRLAQQIVSQREQEISATRRVIGESAPTLGQPDAVAASSSMPRIEAAGVQGGRRTHFSMTVENPETLFSGTTSSEHYIRIDASASRTPPK
jgi:hypothetical protein